MRASLSYLLLVAIGLLAAVVPSQAQAPQYPVIVQLATPSTSIVLTPISATALVNVATVLTIPAPSGQLSNYICKLGFELNNDNTGGVVATNVSTSSTNFNSFAITFSNAGVANTDSGIQTAIPSMNPVGGCIKSTIPGTATTFTSPASLTHTAFTWYASYFVAP